MHSLLADHVDVEVEVDVDVDVDGAGARAELSPTSGYVGGVVSHVDIVERVRR